MKHYSKVKAILRRELCETGNLTATSRHIPRYLCNEVAPGDVIFAEGDGGAELVEVTSVLGIYVRVTLINRARAEVPTAVGGLAFARQGTSADRQPGVITVLGPRHVAVRRPSGVEDDRIPIRRDCMRTFIAEARYWAPDDVWSAVDSGGFWVKSDRQGTYNIARALRLPAMRCDCDGYFSVLATQHEFNRVVSGAGVLVTSPAAGISSNNSDAPHDRQGAGRSATRERRRLGYGTYDDVVAQRCGWKGGISALGELGLGA